MMKNKDLKLGMLWDLKHCTCNSSAVIHLSPVLLLDQIQVGIRWCLQDQMDFFPILQTLTDPVEVLQRSIAIQVLHPVGTHTDSLLQTTIFTKLIRLPFTFSVNSNTLALDVLQHLTYLPHTRSTKSASHMFSGMSSNPRLFAILVKKAANT